MPNDVSFFGNVFIEYAVLLKGRDSHHFPCRTENQATTTTQCRTLLCCCRTLWLGPTDASYISLSSPRPSLTLTSKLLCGQLTHSAPLIAFSFDSGSQAPTFCSSKCTGCHRSGDVRARERVYCRDTCFRELFSVIMLGAGVSHTTSSRRPRLRPATTQGS